MLGNFCRSVSHCYYCGGADCHCCHLVWHTKEYFVYHLWLINLLLSYSVTLYSLPSRAACPFLSWVFWMSESLSYTEQTFPSVSPFDSSPPLWKMQNKPYFSFVDDSLPFTDQKHRLLCNYLFWIGEILSGFFSGRLLWNRSIITWQPGFSQDCVLFKTLCFLYWESKRRFNNMNHCQ